MEKHQIDAIVLDIGMPDSNGLDFLRELRRESQILVLFLTGYSKNRDVVMGFGSGCGYTIFAKYGVGITSSTKGRNENPILSFLSNFIFSAIYVIVNML